MLSISNTQTKFLIKFLELKMFCNSEEMIYFECFKG
jgi:hypothetical protein